MIMTNPVVKNAQQNLHTIMWPFLLLSWTIMDVPKVFCFPRFLVKQKDLRISRSIVMRVKFVDQALALLNLNSAITKSKFSKLFNSYFIISNVIIDNIAKHRMKI